MTQIHCRCSEDDKKEIEQNAASLNITITELILTRCKNLPVRDKNMERRIYQVMMSLTSEMSYIGKNINQAVVAIHKLKFINSHENERLNEFNALFKEYLSKRDHLSAILEKTIE